MTTETVNTQPRRAKWGWGIVLVVTALLLLNGLSWFFIGPDSSQEGMAENLGMALSDFEQTYPDAALSVGATARLVAVWFMGFGLLALLVALEGFRHGARWAWVASWVVVIALLAVGIMELASPFGIVLLVMASLTLVGQLLVSRGSG